MSKLWPLITLAFTFACGDKEEDTAEAEEAEEAVEEEVEDSGEEEAEDEE